jgi:phenylacetate-CoA ligase
MVRYLSTDLAGFYWQAMNVRDHLWHGRDFGLKLAAVRVGGDVERMKNWFGEVGETTLQTGTCVLIPTGTPIPEMADIVQSEDPAYLTGYVNNVVAILKHIDAKAGRLPSLRQVRSFGETVTQAARDYVRQRWGVPFIDLYSAREVGYIALQCPDAGGYHVQAESTYVEILRENGTPCEPGEIGRVVVTPLHNFAFPLIRYNIEDLAEVGPACSCGRGLPVLRRILGRSRNLVKFRDGRTQWPALGVDEFLSIAPIRQFQFVQHSYDDLEIRLAVERPLTENEQASFGRHILERFKHPFHIRWTFLDAIPYSASGKFEDFIRTFDD